MLIGSIKNELQKLYWKKRIHAILGIILFFALLMVALMLFDQETNELTPQNSNWKSDTEEQLNYINSQLASIKDTESNDYLILLNQRNKLEYHIENNINPDFIGAAGAEGQLTSSVTGIFITLILPILTVIVSADLITGEIANGSMKSLLVSPLGRKRILLSKWLAAVIVSIGAMITSDLLTYLVSIPFYETGNWNFLVVIGTDTFNAIPLWKYMTYGLLLNTFMIITLISVFILISILFKNVITPIIISIFIIIFGGLISSLQSNLDVLKYIFIVNIDLASHLTGAFTLQNSSLLLSVAVMFSTICISLILAFTIFTKKDMLI